MRHEYFSLVTVSARQCSTCYKRDGTIASRSINQENNIEVLVIFKKIQFAQGSLNRYEFYSRAKKTVSKNIYHISSIKRENQEVSGHFRLQSCKSMARKCTKKCAAIRPIVVFHSSGQGHPTTVFCKISVRRSKFCLEFSFTWLEISR